MPRDKFAAMASRAKLTKASGAPDGAPETGVGDSPKAQQQQEASVSTSTTTVLTPKRDKIAALAARSITSSMNAEKGNNHEEHAGELNRTASSTPKRDKMAALAARSNMSSSEPVKNDKVVQIKEQQQQEAGKSATSLITTPRRNKLAALASRSMKNSPTITTSAQGAPSRSNKIAKLADAGQSAIADKSTMGKTRTEEEIAAEASIAKQRHFKMLKERLSKRKGILKSLDRAEKLTCKLLKIAAKTTNALQDLNYSPHLSQLSAAYRSTLQELHPLLTMDTEDLIKPYQNHTKETKQSMYAARVEMRLANERLEVLRIFSGLEKAGREKQEGVNATATGADDENRMMEGGDRKRKR